MYMRGRKPSRNYLDVEVSCWMFKRMVPEKPIVRIIEAKREEMLRM